jgi:hypothetical protein
MLKGLMLRRFSLGIMALLMVLIVALVFVFAQEEQLDSTQIKLMQERVKVAIKTSDQYKLLKELGIQCPPFDSTDGRAWELTMNQWQRMQLEKKGIGVSVLSGLKSEEEPRQTEYKLVREIDLGKDGVESIVFGPKKDKGSALSEVIVGVKDENVCIYNSNFTLINKMHLERPSFSKNLRYIGGLEFSKIPEDVSERGTYKFRLFDYTGKMLWELERELYYDSSPNRYSISNEGLVIELNNSSGIFILYDRNGNKIKEMKLYAGVGDAEGQSIGAEFSEDGEYFLVTAKDDYGHAFGEGIGVLFFTCNGEELWRFNTEDKGKGAKNISRLGNYVAVSTKGTTYLLSKEGFQIRKYDHLFATEVCFSSSERYTLITEYYHTCYLILSENGEIASEYGASKRGGSIYASDVAEGANVFGVLCSAMASLIGFDGSTLWSTDFSVPEGPLFRLLNLSLSDDGNQIVIQIGTKIMIYRLVE